MLATPAAHKAHVAMAKWVAGQGARLARTENFEHARAHCPAPRLHLPTIIWARTARVVPTRQGAIGMPLRVFNLFSVTNGRQHKLSHSTQDRFHTPVGT